MIYLLYLLILIIPPAFIFVYRLGIKDGHRIDKGEPLQPIIKHKEVPKPLTKEEIIRMNIENYSGDERGQVKID